MKYQRTAPVVTAIIVLVVTAAVAAQEQSIETSYGEIAATTLRFQAAMRAQALDQAEQLSLSVYHRKTIDPATGQLRVVDLRGAIATPLPASPNLTLTMVNRFYDDFAMTRIDDRTSPAVYVYTLFKTNGIWRVAGEAVIFGDYGTRHEVFSRQNSADQILTSLERYYRAVEHGDAAALADVFARPGWHMKNPDGDVIVAEGPEVFDQRVNGRPVPGYHNDRQVTDLQLAYDSIAVARVDNPTTRSTTVFTYMKIADRWQMIDKAWAFPD